jgi:hypothetical protein
VIEPYVTSVEMVRSRKAPYFSNTLTKTGNKTYKPTITGINHIVGFSPQPGL